MDDLLTMHEIAPLVGLATHTVPRYHQTAERHRREGTVEPADMPPPTARFGKTPVWHRDTIDDWARTRDRLLSPWARRPETRTS